MYFKLPIRFKQHVFIILVLSLDEIKPVNQNCDMILWESSNVVLYIILFNSYMRLIVLYLYGSCVRDIALTV